MSVELTPLLFTICLDIMAHYVLNHIQSVCPARNCFTLLTYALTLDGIGMILLNKQSNELFLCGILESIRLCVVENSHANSLKLYLTLHYMLLSVLH